MTSEPNLTLVCAAALSALAALLHLGIIVGGASWYRFFGAGERMAAAAAAGRVYPTVVTAAIATALLAWSAYALSGAGVLGVLPLRKAALVAITGIYLTRGLLVFPLLLFARSRISAFWLWSSLTCIGFGAVHLAGLVQAWSRL
jgi:hypothetical protein